MKNLLTGNEAVARGAFEAGIHYASAYPGTPSTEILENIARYKGNIIAEWAPNEKVALESAIGASMAGGRALCTMKHVGVNVAADPLFTFAYTGVTGGLVLVSADEPGMHSSQNEQDNRYYAKFSKIPMLEPSDSQESLDMVKAAFDMSEAFDTPVLLRMTTRTCHSKSLVNEGERVEKDVIPYVRKTNKYVAVPNVCRALHVKVDQRLRDLQVFSEQNPLNYIENPGQKIGIITSGISFQYAQEVFGDSASYLKLGMTYPLPFEKIRAFAKNVETLYVIEELEPFIEEQMKGQGISCIGKEKIPQLGELSAEIIRKTLTENVNPVIVPQGDLLVGRPPTLCAGCPHRGFFYALKTQKNIMVTGDIGCYGLGSIEPLNTIDSIICMGASISTGHGAQKIFNRTDTDMRTVAVIGDSTFFHTGINSLINVVYNRSNTVTVILDNRITGMTGHQENPGSGFTLQGMPTVEIDIEAVVKALGVNHIQKINPLNLREVTAALQLALEQEEASVIITRWPCVLKKHSPQDIVEFGDYKGLCHVDEEKCIGCKKCIKTGCPALSYSKTTKTASIDKDNCVGCTVCLQTCPVDAIRKVVGLCQ
jgi:indolepyruvate ferredoxin oxidoreductase alpha subunit